MEERMRFWEKTDITKRKYDFNFEGGKLLNKISAWWFVSYSYYFYVDSIHKKWKEVST